MTRGLPSSARFVTAAAILALAAAFAVVGAFFLFPPGAVAQSAAQSCEQDPDGFEDAETDFEVNCASEDMTVTRQPDGEVATAKLQARKKEGEETISVMLITVSTAQNFEGSGASRLVADDMEMDVPLRPTGDSKRMEEGIMFEVKRLALSRSEARQVSQADSVRLETGEAAFQLGPLPGQLREVLRLSDQ